MPYHVKLLAGIEKQLRRIPHTEGERVVEAMRSFRLDPRPGGCVHLEDKLFQIRVGLYRVIYAAFDDQVVVLECSVAQRTEATYRDLRALMSRARKALEEK